MGVCNSATENPRDTLAMQHLEDMHGNETAAGMKKLAAALAQANEKTFKTPLKHTALVDFSMILKQCQVEQRYKKPTTSLHKFVNNAVLMRSARYTAYAKAALETTPEAITQVIHGDEAADFGGNLEVLHVHTPSVTRAGQKTDCPGFFIAVDSANSDVVLCIRGAETAGEAILDATSRTVPFMMGQTSEVLLNRARALIEAAQQPLEEALTGHPGHSLAVVGHSTGGAIGILALIEGFGGEGTAATKLLEAGQAKVYAFGPPPTYLCEGKIPKKLNSAVYEFVNNMDIIPRACAGSLGKLMMAVRQVDEMESDRTDRVNFLAGEGPGMQKFPDVVNLPAELQSELPVLHGLGTVLQLYRLPDGKMACEIVNAGQFDKILVHEDMISDHLLESYEEKIMEYVSQIQKTKGCC